MKIKPLEAAVPMTHRFSRRVQSLNDNEEFIQELGAFMTIHSEELIAKATGRQIKMVTVTLTSGRDISVPVSSIRAAHRWLDERGVSSCD